MEPVLLDNRHPLASTVEVKRPWHLGMTAHEMPVAAEYIDFDKADPTEAADLCADRDSMAKAMAVCHVAWRDVAKPIEGVVYVAAPKSGEVCKIGMATDPAGRLSGLQSAHWENLDFHAIFWCVQGPMELLERAALHALAKMQIRGEWFNCAPEFGAMAVAVAARELGYKVADSSMWLRQREAIRRQRHALELRSASFIKATDTTKGGTYATLSRFR